MSSKQVLLSHSNQLDMHTHKNILTMLVVQSETGVTRVFFPKLKPTGCIKPVPDIKKAFRFGLWASTKRKA